MSEEDPTRYYQPSSPYSPRGLTPNADEAGDQHPWSVGFEEIDVRKYRYGLHQRVGDFNVRRVDPRHGLVKVGHKGGGPRIESPETTEDLFQPAPIPLIDGEASGLRPRRHPMR